MKNRIKSLLISVISLSFLLVSCANSVDSTGAVQFFASQQKQEKLFLLSGSIGFSGAIPKELAPVSSDSRTAYSSVPADVFYEVIAESTTAGTKDCEVNGNQFSVYVPNGSWKIIVSGYSDSEKTKKILSGSKTISVGSTASVTVVVTPASKTATGNIQLAFRTESTAVKSVEISSSNSIIETSQNFSNKTAVFEMENIASGNYDVTFKFYDSNNEICYFIRDHIYVYDYLTTSTWVKSFESCSYIDEENNCIYITDALIESFTKDSFFISQSGNDSNDGTFFSPYKTFVNAVSFINSSSKAGRTYTIYLLSDITADSLDISDGAFGKNLILFAGDKTLNVRIEGLTGTPAKISVPAASDSRILRLSGSATVTLKNLILTGGDLSSSGDGGAAYLSDGAELILDDNTSIAGNKAQRGGGIFADNSEIIVRGTDVDISSNTATRDYSDYGGGGVYLYQTVFTCEDSSSLKMTSNKAARHGGAVFAIKGSNLNIQNAELSNNAANFDNPSANYMGGAIYATYDNKRDSNNFVTITNSSFYENTATFGAAVCMYGLTYLVVGGSAADGGKVDFYNNTARSNGGAINIIDVSVTNDDYSITWLENSLTLYDNVNIYNNTIQESSALGSGIYCESEVFLFGTTKVVTGNDFYYNWTDKESLPTKVLKPIQLMDNIAVNNQAFFKITLPQEFYKESTQLLELNGYNSDNTKLISITPQSAGGSTVSWTLDSNGFLKKGATEVLYTDPNVVSRIPSSGDEIKLTAPNDLKYISTLTAAGNDLEGVYFEITGDLTAAADYVPIGNTSDKPFKGIINGKGHYIKITNFAKENDEYYAGLVRFNGGIIENIVIALEGYEDTTSNFYNCVVPNIWCGSAGLICQENLPNGIIRNCWNRTNLTTIGCPHGFGGLAGINKGKIINCLNTGKLHNDCSAGNEPRVGGIAGNMQNVEGGIPEIINCVNYGKIESEVAYSNSKGFFGAIAGILSEGTVGYIKNCYIYTQCIDIKHSYFSWPYGFRSDKPELKLTVQNCGVVFSDYSVITPCSAEENGGWDEQTLSLYADNLLDALNGWISASDGGSDSDNLLYAKWKKEDSGRVVLDF